MDGDDGVHLLLAEGAHKVIGTLLHLGVGTLNGVQFYTIAIAPRVNRRHAAAT